jgi:copper resistance protein B
MKTANQFFIAVCLFFSVPAFAGSSADPLLFKFMGDQLEWVNDDADSKAWDVFAWAGHDWNKLWFYSEGEQSNGETESENMLLYGRPIAPFWDIQAGIGRDSAPEGSQTWGVVGINGLAPYFFETQAHVLIGDGVAGLRTSFEYELLFTQFLILSSELEADFYSDDLVEMGFGKGLSTVSASMRLRYEIRREFAPYIGYEWTRAYGNTASFRQQAGQVSEDASWVAGFRIWF